MLQLAAYVLVALGLAVLVTTFPGRGHIMVPGLLAVFGMPFAITFLLLQYGLAAMLRSWRAVALVTAVCLLGMGLGGCGAAMDLWGELDRYGVSALRQVLVGGSCVSAIALGAAILKGWVYPRR